MGASSIMSSDRKNPKEANVNASDPIKKNRENKFFGALEKMQWKLASWHDIMIISEMPRKLAM